MRCAFLRDRLTIEEAAQLGAQLPLLLKGIYFDQWRPAGKPEELRSVDEFLDRVGTALKDIRRVNTELAVRSVFKAVAHHVSPGEVEDVKASLPREIRALWPDKTTADANS